MTFGTAAHSVGDNMMPSRVPPLPELVYTPIADWIEPNAVIVIKQDDAWRAARARGLSWDIGIELDALVTTEEAFTRLAQRCRNMGDVIYAIGGRAAADAAKFVAKELQLPLICVPTALCADAFFTSCSYVWRDGCPRAIEAIPPELVLLDLDLIAAAPAQVRAASIVDVLSIATACYDWELAESRGKNPPAERYQPRIAEVARGLLALALDCAEAAGRGDPAGLQALVNVLAMEVQLRNLVGHSRFALGSEHHFAYCAEMLASAATWRGEIIPAPFTHGELVGPGIILMAERQGQDAQSLRRALDAAGVPMDGLPRDLIEST
ncbi:MAG: iron-containing alcohol dehydrogenase, partial [Anaerolineae bacterium]|nr:iron-containing alcohol dehydrogenase [Candidatus Roseilinea sp.]MDW8448361.1 iron-containing alcohol dehydrogenase [Anaerolineae bacterium]